LTDLPPLDPIPRVSFRLRILGYGAVHQGDLDTGDGIATLCGKYLRTGNYEKTEDPLSCRLCVRTDARQSGASRSASPDATGTTP
jgi:hypothetical protein